MYVGIFPGCMYHYSASFTFSPYGLGLTMHSLEIYYYSYTTFFDQYLLSNAHIFMHIIFMHQLLGFQILFHYKYLLTYIW